MSTGTETAYLPYRNMSTGTETAYLPYRNMSTGTEPLIDPTATWVQVRNRLFTLP